MTIRSEVPATDSFVRMPPGGPAIVTVLEKRYRDAIVRETILANDSSVSGQNFMRVTLYGTVGYRTVLENSLGRDSIAPSQIGREFQWYLLGVPMKTSMLYAQNRYGPFGFATGTARSGDRCLYAWQLISRPRFTEAGSIGIRLRFCDRRATDQQLLAMMYKFEIVGYLPSRFWNPYGRPPRVSETLGAMSAPVEPELPTASVAPARTRPAVIPAPQPVRPIEGPIVPLPGGGGTYDDYPVVPPPGG